MVIVENSDHAPAIVIFQRFRQGDHNVLGPEVADAADQLKDVHGHKDSS
jgi:hypothetical protein